MDLKCSNCVLVLERDEGGRDGEEACRMFSAREGVWHVSFYSRLHGKRRGAMDYRNQTYKTTCQAANDANEMLGFEICVVAKPSPPFLTQFERRHSHTSMATRP
jgi:hypothetical protein